MDALGARVVVPQVIGPSCGLAGAASVSLMAMADTVTFPVLTTVNV